MPDKTVDDLAESIRQMKSEIRDLKGQLAINKLGNQTIYQALSNQVIEKPIINDPASTGDATWAGSATFNSGVAVDSGDLVVHTSGDLKTPTLILEDGTANPSTITKTADADEVVFSNDIVVLTGKFASSTVEIGGQTISEDGELVIADAVTPGVKLKDTTRNLAGGAIGRFYSLDNANASIFSLIGIGADTVRLNSYVDKITFGMGTEADMLHMTATTVEPETTNTVDLGTDAKSFKDAYFDGQVNFATGTTYKVEADGDAAFKNVSALGGTLIGGVDGSISGLVDLWANDASTEGGQISFKGSTDGVNLSTTDWHIDRSVDNLRFFYGASVKFQLHGDTTRARFNAETEVNGITQLGDGGVTNYAQFAADGTLTLLGTAKVTKRVELANSILERGATAPTLTYIDNFVGWAYSINDDSVLTWLVPDDWDSSAGIIVEASWYIDEAFTVHKEVRFECAYSLVPHDESELIDAPTHTGTLTGSSQNIPTLAKELTTTHIGTIPAGSIAAGDEIGLTFKRIAALEDDPTAEPVVIHLELEYTANKLGT